VGDGLGRGGHRLQGAPLGQGPRGGRGERRPRRGRLPRRPRPGARRRAALGRPHRRPEGARGLPPRARPPRGGHRPLLALAPRAREPLLRLRAVRARRSPRLGRPPALVLLRW
jgi:hypothetical protein